MRLPRMIHLLKSLALVSLATSVFGQSLTLPLANITPSDPVVTISNSSIQLTCTGSGSLRWYMNDLNTPLTELSDQVNDTLFLTANVSDFSTSGSDVSLFCAANNSLGTHRSRSVVLTYFQGFQGENDTNDTIVVRLGEAVALFCNISVSQSMPTIVWYKNDELIPAVFVSDEMLQSGQYPRYNLLNDGQWLVIYDLTNDDITDNNLPIGYKCGVMNVLNPQNSSILFTLIPVTTLSSSAGQFISYRPPMNQIVSRDQSPVQFFYIGGANPPDSPTPNQETFVNSQDSVTVTNTDRALCRVRIENNGESRSGLRMRLDADTVPVAGSSVTVRFTVADSLTVLQVPTNDSNTPFHRFERESINFTCAANGTDVTLTWYFNGAPLTVDGDTLVLTNLSLDDIGVYQCFWRGFFEDDFESTAWALTVQTPVQPRSFSFVTSPTAGDTFNRTVVRTGSNVTLTLSFIADSLPTVVWMFTTTNGTIAIDLVNNTEYESNGPVRVNSNEDMYTISLTIISVTMETTGYYHAVLSDGRTPPTETNQWFITQRISTQVESFAIAPNNCFLAGVNSTLTCVVRSLPDPTIQFRRSNAVFQPDMTTTDRFTGVSTSVLIIGNSMNDGEYICEADVPSIPSFKDNRPLVTQFCRNIVITPVNSPVSGTVGSSAELNCTVVTAPAPVVQWLFNGTELPSGDKYNNRSEGNVYRLTISSLTMADDGVYQCFVNNSVIPETSDANITLTVSAAPIAPTSFPVVYVGIGVGGGVAIAVIVLLILVFCVWICYSTKKTGNYNTRHSSKDFTDGRGNVDQDSDEEDGGREEPEAFQPQYESLPALRPSQPPQYKPSPAYNQGFSVTDDMEMVKMPIPQDSEFEYQGPPPGGYYPQHDNGMAGSLPQYHQAPPIGGSAVRQGSQVALQARFDDFMSDDGQFV